MFIPNYIFTLRTCRPLIALLMLWGCLLLLPTRTQAQCTCTNCPCTDSLQLVALYNSTNGANWTAPVWNLNQPMQNWSGIALDANRRVTVIELWGVT